MAWIRLIPVLAGAALLSGALRDLGFYRITGREAEGLRMLLHLFGEVYAVLFSFAIFVVWGQFAEVENCLARECSSLREILRFSEYLETESRSRVRRAVTDYATAVFKHEWSALGQGRKDKQAEAMFGDILAATVEAKSSGRTRCRSEPRR